MEEFHKCPQCEGSSYKASKKGLMFLKCLICNNVFEIVTAGNNCLEASFDALTPQERKIKILSAFKLPFLVNDVRKEFGQPGPSKDYNNHFANPSTDDELFLDTE